VDNARNFTFEGVTAVKVVMVFWFVTPWRWRQYVPPVCWYLPTSRHGGKTQKTNIDTTPGYFSPCTQSFIS
jgi:hypothetical protein